MSRLEDFLGLVDINEVRENVVIPFNGKDLEFVVKPISEEEHSEFQKRCNVVSKNKVTFDTNKYIKLMLEACIVEPNFNDPEFLKKVGCVSGIEFLERKLPAGILTELGSRIQKLSGFDSFELEVENAKN